MKPLRTMGATIAGRKGGELAPLAITGSRLRASPMCRRSRVLRSNRHSCLLRSMPTASRRSPSRDSRRTTPNMFAYFGIPFQREGCTVRIEGRPLSAGPGSRWWCLGDLSAAAFSRSGSFDCAGFRCDDSWSGHMNPTRTDWWRSFNRWVRTSKVLRPREEARRAGGGFAGAVQAAARRADRARSNPQTIDNSLSCGCCRGRRGTVITGAETASEK